MNRPNVLDLAQHRAARRLPPAHRQLTGPELADLDREMKPLRDTVTHYRRLAEQANRRRQLIELALVAWFVVAPIAAFFAWQFLGR